MQLNSPLLCKFHLHSIPLPPSTIFSLLALCPQLLLFSSSPSRPFFLSFSFTLLCSLPITQGLALEYHPITLEYFIYFVQMTRSLASFHLLPEVKKEKST